MRNSLLFGAACSGLTLLFTLIFLDNLFVSGTLDGNIRENFRNRIGQPNYTCVPCVERGCEAEERKLGMRSR